MAFILRFERNDASQTSMFFVTSAHPMNESSTLIVGLYFPDCHLCSLERTDGKRKSIPSGCTTYIGRT